jgi:uncharacterized protein YndB with AHSA1/START domain
MREDVRPIPARLPPKGYTAGMHNRLLATASIRIDAPVAVVWDAIVNPAVIKGYMFGTEVVTDWKEGSPIVWKGVWKDKPYEDKGEILVLVPQNTLQVTHFSPLSGEADVPENYHTLTYEVTREGEGTRVSLTQDNNKDETEVEHSKTMWENMLQGMKRTVEGAAGQ